MRLTRSALAIDIDAQVLEFLLESALHEAIGHDAAARKAVLSKLEDDRVRRQRGYSP